MRQKTFFVFSVRAPRHARGVLIVWILAPSPNKQWRNGCKIEIIEHARIFFAETFSVSVFRLRVLIAGSLLIPLLRPRARPQLRRQGGRRPFSVCGKFRRRALLSRSRARKPARANRAPRTSRLRETPRPAKPRRASSPILGPSWGTRFLSGVRSGNATGRDQHAFLYTLATIARPSPPNMRRRQD